MIDTRSTIRSTAFDDHSIDLIDVGTVPTLVLSTNDLGWYYYKSTFTAITTTTTPVEGGKGRPRRTHGGKSLHASRDL